MHDPVENQLRAFNRRDLDAFMEPYAGDARIEDGSGEEGFPEETRAAVTYRIADGEIDFVRMLL